MLFCVLFSKSKLAQKRKIAETLGISTILNGTPEGIFSRHYRAYRLTSLVATSAKTVHRTVFFRKSKICSFLVRIPSFFIIKQKESTQKCTPFSWHAGRDFFSALPCLSPRYARCHVSENSPLDCFLPQIKDLLLPCSNPFLFHHKTKTEHTKSVLCFRGTPEGIRTPDLLVRSQTLYPAELPAHMRLFIARI